MTDQIKQKTSKYYCCENCDYVTSRKSNLNAHVNSAKHLILTDTDPTTSKIHNQFINIKFTKLINLYR